MRQGQFRNIGIDSASLFPQSEHLTCRPLADTVCSPMLSVIENLLILQDRDRRIQRVEMELNNIGPERTALQEKARAAQVGHEAAKNKSKHIESERKNLE